MATLVLIARALRVKQWSKNVLVFAAPAAAGVLLEPDVLTDTLLAFASFSLLASSMYVINDIRDIEADRHHPRKSQRPFASGQLSVGVGYVLAAGCLVVGVALAAVLPAEFALVAGTYVANTVVYTLVGKRIPTIEMLQVALGFVLRAVAGAAATDISLSQWFLGVAMFGSLLMIAGKRSSEVAHVGDAPPTRAVLASYTSAFLHQVTTISATGLLMTYALWALSDSGVITSPWALISFAPALYAVLRYVQLSDQGDTEEPEALVLTDAGLLAAAVTWAGIVAIGIYA